jgi:polysaccharide export outer membrane protein
MRLRNSSILFLILVAVVPFVAAQASGEDAASSAENDSYVIGIEDVIRVVVWNEDELTLSQKVRPDGRITVPLVNDVLVAGKTPQQVSRDITAALGDYIRDPNVTVIVEEINSFRVYFLGEVTEQGPIQFYRPTRLMQGIATAGGLTEFANKKSVVLLREDGAHEKRIRIDFKALWEGEPGHENLLLQPGDTILVK